MKRELFFLVLVFTFCQCQNDIIGGEQSIFYNVGGYFDYSLLDIGSAAIYDPDLFRYRYGAFYGALIVDIENYYLENYGGISYTGGSFFDQQNNYRLYTNNEISYDYQVYVSPTLPVARVLVTFTAIDSSLDANVTISSYSGANPNIIFGDYDGNLEFDLGDYWVILGDGEVDYLGRYDGVPYVTYSVYGPGASVTPFSVNIDEFGYIDYVFNLQLQAGVPQSLIFFLELNLSPQSALQAATVFSSTAALRSTDLLFALTPSDLSNIVNWDLSVGRKVSSYTGICDFASEVKNRVSKVKTNQRHTYSQPWRC